MKHIKLEAELKFTDENLYNLYLSNPKWHNNVEVLQAMIATADSYNPIFIEHEEELEKVKQELDSDSFDNGYSEGLADGETKYHDLVEKVESLIQCIELDDTKSNIEIAIAQVKRECP